MRSAPVLVLACLLPATAHAQADAPPPPPARLQALAGCYALTVGDWSPARRLELPLVTTVVRLDTVAHPRRRGPWFFGAQRMAPDTAPAARLQAPPFRKLPRWRLVGPDSVEITHWATSFEAEVFYGRVVGDSLHGVFRQTSDAVPVDRATGQVRWDAYPTAPARGRRVPCPVTSSH